jgi:hypothetical protein
MVSMSRSSRQYVQFYNAQCRAHTANFYFSTCIFLSRRLFRVTLEISRAECNVDVTPGTLTATDTCIGYHVTGFEASRKVILQTPYVSICVGAGGEWGRGTKVKTKANRCGACL